MAGQEELYLRYHSRHHTSKEKSDFQDYNINIFKYLRYLTAFDSILHFLV